MQVQSTSSIRECNPSFVRAPVYTWLHARILPSPPRGSRFAPKRAEKRLFERSFELFIALEFCRGTASRHGRERGSKGKERKGKGRKKERGWFEEDAKEGEACVYTFQTRLVYQRFGFFPTFFPSPIIPDSIFLGRNDLRHGPSPSSGSEEGLEDWSGRKGKEAGWTSTSEIFIITHASSGEEGGFLGNVFEADCFFLMDASNRFLGNRDNGGLFLFLDLKCFMLWIFIWVACIWNTSRSRNN